MDFGLNDDQGSFVDVGGESQVAPGPGFARTPAAVPRRPRDRVPTLAPSWRNLG
ncbi:MAG TPA: hypothetical protein VGM12_00510 [Trebonia sp.]